VTKNRARTAPYLQDVYREIALQGELFADRPVEQLHWGGGTPTFLSNEDMRALMETIRRHFRLRNDDVGEYSIEIDPREVRTDTLALLREVGFNRLSMGVQDFDPAVQQAVNRIQSQEQTLGVLQQARALGFRSVNMDLIYGLPKQTVESFSRTLEAVIAADPDRLSVFNYAHLPEMFKTQRQIVTTDLPGPEVKLAILQRTVERLTAAGYLYIGMDHFAKPDDELAVAQRNGTLYRNFQGYSTHADCDLIGVGVTSIGRVGNTYSQNQKTLPAYSAALAAGQLPVYRGVELTSDDVLRRAIITALMCHFRLDIQKIEHDFSIDFAREFADELTALRSMEGDGLITLGPKELVVSRPGKFLIRNICMVFDRYLRREITPRYSKAI
jgi:oxygen-independent coproporphyrinogen-3 oxidase